MPSADRSEAALWRPSGHNLPPTSSVWTRADVERALLKAFRLMPYTAIYAPRGNTLQAASGEAEDATFDLIAFSGTVLGDHSDERRALLFWARSKATGGGVGGSVAQFCKDNRMKWSRATFDRARIRACEKIAAAKNGEGRHAAA